jgi:hypothetical protein
MKEAAVLLKKGSRNRERLCSETYRFKNRLGSGDCVLPQGIWKNGSSPVYLHFAFSQLT